MDAVAVEDRLVGKEGKALDAGAARSAGRPRLRLLLSSAGRRVGLLRAFRASAAVLGVDLAIFACDIQPEWSAACLEADYAFAVPPAGSPAFVETLLAYCERHAIAMVVPTIDTELLPLSLARARFAAIGTTVVVGAPELIEMARDKQATADFLAHAGIPSPRTASAEDVLAGTEDWPWPLLAKPRHGSASRGIQVVADRAALAAIAGTEPYIVQEKLVGREFTVNLFFDQQGRLKCAVPHERIRVRAGEVEKGATIRDPLLCALARSLGEAMIQPAGAMCFQAIKADDHTASVFEINARFGGGYPLAHRAGATFTRWLIEQQLGLESTAGDDWQSSVVMLRYDDAVFV